MSEEINCHSNRFLATPSATTIIGDPSSSQPLNESPPKVTEIRSVLPDAMGRLFRVDDSQYPPALLAELSALVRRVRASSPNSVLADIADTKIGRIIALCEDANI
ncbi:hypothetical protein [Microvirga yunnanensis]|uniref:hypothetical protein n=1 Tax=Microvirga yunnanensis TaxID=2953740 RepID=UPI0021C9DACE|nr:hypothetical protein [Microvirga sp. HBU65207]